MGIDASLVAPVIVTRGNVDLSEIYESLNQYGFARGYVWDATDGDEDLGVYGRYAAIEKLDAPVIYVQDDDCVLPPGSIRALLASYEPGVLVANLPRKFRERYTDSCLVGFGAIFDRELPQRAWDRFFGMFRNGKNIWQEVSHLDGPECIAMFERTCDVVFSTLTPRKVLDLPYRDLPWALDESRMWRQPGHFEERLEMLNLARAVRDRVTA